MPIVVECNCGKRFNAPDAYAGKRAKCTACGAELLIPNVAKATAKTVSVAPRKPVASSARPAAKPQTNPLDDDALFDVVEPAPAAPPPRRSPVTAASASAPAGAARATPQAAVAPTRPTTSTKSPPQAYGRRNFQPR